jgi:RNA polymerase primary sigma factor
MATEESLQLYFDQIGSSPTLTPARERELAHLLIRENDSAARDEMVRSNLRLVVRIAKNYAGRGLSLQDLIQEGNLGLLRAVEGFNPDMNMRFATYACWWIKQSIRRALVRASHPIRIPEYMAVMLTRWKRATAKLESNLGRDPTIEEVTCHLKLSAKMGLVLHQAARDFGSTTQIHASNEHGVGLQEVLGDARSTAPEDVASGRDQIRTVQTLLSRISSREAEILRLRFGLENGKQLTLKEIGENLGLTRERVRQITNEALGRLNCYLSAG